MDNQVYRWNHLGGRTLFLFILKRTGILVVLFLFLAGSIAAASFIPAAYAGYAVLAASIFSAIFVLAVLLVLFIGWLEYHRYKIFLDEDSIKVSRGILSERTVGIPYRQVKQASIERSIFYQILGMSRLVLEVLGHDEERTLGNETRIILPALGRKTAEQIQNVILMKSEVEKVDMHNESHG